MESPERKPVFNVQQSLENIATVSDVEKVELDEEYFTWAKEHFSKEDYKRIEENYASIDAYKYKYLSDDLNIAGYLWVPKEIKEKLPVIVWNRGGSSEIGSTGQKIGNAYIDIPCELVKNGAIVVGSEYRGAIGSEGKDEWGGNDLNDVVRVKEIADQLPMSKPGKSVVVGRSRGGMMSYLLAAREPWVKAIVSLAGTTDIAQSAEERPEMREIFTKAFGGGEEEMKKRSATEFYKEIPKDIPLLIMHTEDDTRVSVDQARKLVGLLESNGNHVEYHEFKEGGHSFNNPKSPHAKEISEIMNRFLKEQLKA